MLLLLVLFFGFNWGLSGFRFLIKWGAKLCDG
jgi:hypothetical protein